ncbi:MAG: sensor histidine kinase, partial [Paracoccaceae bacterium]
SQISHELRTPMTAILSFTEILRDNHGLSETQVAQYAEIIYDEAHRLTRLLDDLLDLSVLENGQVRLNLAETDIVEVINRATHTALSAKSGADLKIWVKMPENLPRIVTDADRLGQVFLNLISNAQKYCNKAPASLRIKGVVRGTFITLDFIDNGQGVPREEQELIFEKFSRIGQPESSGAGLGLAICKEIMSRLGGDIDYLPGQGGGAFRVVLPL